MNPYSTASLYNPEELTFQKPMGIDEALREPVGKTGMELTPAEKTGIKTGAQTMSAGGTTGQALTGGATAAILSGAPVMGAAGAVGAAGLALSLYEQNQQAEAAHERAVAEEAQNRKNAVQSAINQQIAAARLLSV